MANLTASASIEINATPEQVWDAVTNPEMVKKYFFGTTMEANLIVGGDITFTGEWEGKAYQDKGKVLEIETNKILKYSYWSAFSGKDDKPENYANVTYKITQKDSTTILEVSQDRLQSDEAKETS